MDELIEEVKDKVYTQDYSKKEVIEGVKIVEIKNFVGEDGDFSEVIRIGENGEAELFPGFKILQINRSKILPKTTKAWHIHLLQDEIWYPLPFCNLIVGLWDLRKNSKTSNVKMRIPIGSESHKIIFIPKGVAHGYTNLSNRSSGIFYFVNQKFDVSNPDEKRIPWDSLGKEFWDPQKD